MAGASEPIGHAPRQSVGDPPQPSRGGGAGGRVVDGDLAPFERLLDALRRPYDEAPELAPYAEPAPAAVTACYQTFCGT